MFTAPVCESIGITNTLASNSAQQRKSNLSAQRAAAELSQALSGDVLIREASFGCVVFALIALCVS